jgi:hypothetical protein
MATVLGMRGEREVIKEINLRVATQTDMMRAL